MLTAGLVAATLTACNDKEAKSDATKAQAPANDTVYLYTWTEYVPDGLLDEFTKETGIKVYRFKPRIKRNDVCKTQNSRCCWWL